MSAGRKEGSHAQDDQCQALSLVHCYIKYLNEYEGNINSAESPFTKQKILAVLDLIYVFDFTGYGQASARKAERKILPVYEQG